MTEAEWLACDDYNRMLVALRAQKSKRKLRLFAAACGRSLEGVLDELGWNAVTQAERFADDPAAKEDLKAAQKAAARAYTRAAKAGGSEATTRPLWAAAWLSALNARDAASHAGVGVLELSGRSAQASARLCGLVRDVFGNPYRKVRADPLGLAAGGGVVVKLATAIYERRAFDRLPVLADALEEAGCADAEVLTHCRSGGEHVRGCWVVDTVLGKG